jgi:CheY-like chemotaxis protein
LEDGEHDNNDTISDKNISRTRTMAHTNKPYNILLVDDENDVLITMKQILEDSGFLVYPFSNPLEALSAFKPGVYDFVLIDVKMPQMNGFELYQNIRKRNKNIDIKTCFMTGYDVYYELLKKEFPGLNVGCFISKPVKAEELVNRINQVLQ